MRHGKKPVIHQKGARYWRRIAMTNLGHKETTYETLTRMEQRAVDKAAKSLRLARQRNIHTGEA